MGSSTKLSELRHFFEIEADLQRPKNGRPRAREVGTEQREIQTVDELKALVRGRRSGG